jgi:HEPN domain-containing protein
MNGLFKIKRYSDSLFFGHIVLEKILKALVVKKTQEQAEYTHNLVKLMQSAELNLSQKDQDLLDIVNDFNIRARYPDDKLRFYKRCTKQYTIEYLALIKKLYKKLCQKLKENNS